MSCRPTSRCWTLLFVAGQLVCSPGRPTANTAAPAASTGADWAGKSATVTELVHASKVSVVAEVKAVSVAHIVNQYLPQMNAERTPVATVTGSTLFSDTTFAVQGVYSGSVATTILVTQAGGVSRSTGQTDGPIDDLLYAVGEVYVLSLKYMSGDPMHAPDRPLFRTVSPAGRFVLENGSVQSFTPDRAVKAVQPSRFDDLVSRIRQTIP